MRDTRFVRAAFGALGYATAVALSCAFYLFALGAWDIRGAMDVIALFALGGAVVGAIVGWHDEPATPYFD